MANEQSGEQRPFCLNEAAHSGVARLGRALGRMANLCRAPTHSSTEPQAREAQATSMYPGSVDTIPEDDVADASYSGRADVEQGLSHSSSSSVGSAKSFRVDASCGSSAMFATSTKSQR